MANRDKLLLLATIYMLLPGAAMDVQAADAEAEKPNTKRSAPVQKTHAPAASTKRAPKK